MSRTGRNRAYMGFHAPGRAHLQVPRASVTRARFSAVAGCRFGSSGPRVAAICFVARVPGQLRNMSRVAWPRTHVAGRLEPRFSRRRSTRVRWLLAHGDLLSVDTWRVVAFSLFLAEKRGFRLVFRCSSHFSIFRFLIQTYRNDFFNKVLDHTTTYMPIYFLDFYLIIRRVMSVGKRSDNILTVLGKILRSQCFV